jgi:hypothetical protein
VKTINIEERKMMNVRVSIEEHKVSTHPCSTCELVIVMRSCAKSHKYSIAAPRPARGHTHHAADATAER